MFYTPGWGSLATSVIALSAIGVSTYWNWRTLRASDQRSADDRGERTLDRKRAAIADVAAAGGQYVDALSLVRIRIGGVTQTKANDLSVIGQLHSAITDQYVPAKRELVTRIWSAQFVINEDDLRHQLDLILEKLEDDLIIEEQYVYDSTADSVQANRQEEIRHAISQARGIALRLFGST